MMNLKGFRKIFLPLTEMLLPRPLFEGQGELGEISIKTECDLTKVQIRYLPITSLYICLSRVHFSTVEYRMQYNSQEPTL